MANLPLTTIAVGLGGPGAAKLAGAQFTRDNFEKWGFPAFSRIVVGAVEVGLAGAALSAMRDPLARPVVAVGTLATMAGAIATHIKAGDSPVMAAPAVAVAVAGAAVLVGK